MEEGAFQVVRSEGEEDRERSVGDHSAPYYLVLVDRGVKEGRSVPGVDVEDQGA